MAELLIGGIGVLLGGLISWLITHAYYRRSSVQPPEWAKAFMERLPNAPVSDERLIQLYHEALQAKRISPDPFTGYLVCPQCSAPSSEFQYYDEAGVVYCPSCNWSQPA